MRRLRPRVGRVQWRRRPTLRGLLRPGGAAAGAGGLYRADFGDVLSFNQTTWIAANEPADCFDFNGNGRIDFADVVWLLNHL